MTILIYWWALQTFLAKLPRELIALYRNALSYHRWALIVRDQLRDGYAPETLARQACAYEGVAVGSPRYHELFESALEIKARFNV